MTALMDVRDYAHADSLLQGRNASERVIGHNTRLERDRHDGCIRIRFHATAIIDLWPDGALTLRANGWTTVTTATRFRQYLPSPWHIGSHRVGKSSAWWLWHGGFPILPFVDGITIRPDESISMGHNGPVLMTADEIDRERERLTAAREAFAVKRAERLTAQHLRGADGAFGMASSWEYAVPGDWQSGRSIERKAYHPRAYGGYTYDCPLCVAMRKDGAA